MEEENEFDNDVERAYARRLEQIEQRQTFTGSVGRNFWTYFYIGLGGVVFIVLLVIILILV